MRLIPLDTTNNGRIIDSALNMSEGRTKCKIVSFRVSDDEYGAVETVSRMHGFTSVSLFARSATLTCNSYEPVHTPLDVEINRLWRRLETLTTILERITAQLNLARDPLRAD